MVIAVLEKTVGVVNWKLVFTIFVLMAGAMKGAFSVMANKKPVSVVIGGGNTRITDSKVWKDFVNRLNNPSQEIVDNRRRFFEECDKLFITSEDDSVLIESDKLNTEEILKILRT